MRALTLRAPWPWAFRLGKRIENRTWFPSNAKGQIRPGERFALHGGAWPKKLDHGQLEEVAFIQRVAGTSEPPEHLEGIFATCRYLRSITKLPVTGTVMQVEVRRREPGQPLEDSLADDPWFFGPYGWVLSDFQWLPEPIPFPGKLGLWTVPPHLLAELTAR